MTAERRPIMNGSPMDRALGLGRRALGLSSPNPAVGAVIVRDGEIVGEGFTREHGGRHAEIVALEQAGDLARGATMYTTLEPCSHHGRTPPCVEAMIEAGLHAAEIAVLDSHPLVNGTGRRALEESGITTRVGQCADEARLHFQGYFKRIATGMPLVIAKYAMSLDGKIATHTGSSQWITGEDARARVHELRSTVDAIITGTGTLSQDDPQLTARDAEGRLLDRQPLRVIADSHGRAPTDARVFHEPGRVLVATASDDACRPFREIGENVSTVAFPGEGGRVDLPALLRHLGQEGALQVMTEAGEALLGALFDEDLVDQAEIYIAPLVIGGRDARGPVGGSGVADVGDARRFKTMSFEQVGPDMVARGVLRRWDGETE